MQQMTDVVHAYLLIKMRSNKDMENILKLSCLSNTFYLQHICC